MNHDTLGVYASMIDYKLKAVRNNLKIEAFAVFDKNHSWIMEKTQRILDHEQGHFDIAEIYAVRFEKKVNDSLIRDADVFLDYLNACYKEIAVQGNVAQAKYDIYTMNTLGRQEYDKWIGEKLDPLARGRCGQLPSRPRRQRN